MYMLHPKIAIKTLPFSLIIQNCKNERPWLLAKCYFTQNGTNPTKSTKLKLISHNMGALRTITVCT